jgi:hypothetical protein
MYYHINAYQNNFPYYHCRIVLWGKGELPYGTANAIEAEWQTDDNKPEHRWYAGRLNLTTDSGDRLDEKINLARKVGKALFGEGRWEAVQPQEFISAIITRYRAVQVVKDERLNEYLPLDQVADPRMLRWIDDYDTLGRRYCTYGALAHNQEEAQKLIMAQASDRMDTDFIQRFIDLKLPVLLPHYQKAPDIRPWQEVLNLWPIREAA